MTAASPMPVWIDESTLDAAWLSAVTKLPVQACTVDDVSNAGRKGARVCDGATLRVTIESPESRSLIIKQVSETGEALSRQLGLAREGLFYQHLGSDLDSLPRIYYSYGDAETGRKVVVMEDLSESTVDSSVFFGPGNPHNWSKDLVTLSAKGGNAPMEIVAETTFVSIAKVHARYWKSEALLNDKYAYLRGHAWLQGQGKESWEGAQGLARMFWKKHCDGEGTSIEWNPLVRETVEHAMEGISWEKQLERLRVGGHWTLVHGDFWPGNVLWTRPTESSSGSISLLDWEMVGLGSGPQDLGQYAISNMSPTERRACEERLLRRYHQTLVEEGVDVTFEHCWTEYIVGGIERWLWFLVYFAGQPQGNLPGWAQFFHDQIAAFMLDHKIGTSHVTQPRP